MEMIALIAPPMIMVACAFVGARWEGLSDAKRAIANLDVEHTGSAMIRIVGACCVSVLCMAVFGLTLLQFALLVVIGVAAFNPVFRYTMNKKRAKHWCYISPKSNFYDDSFWSFFMIVVHDWTPDQTALWRADHDKAWRDAPKFWETHEITIEKYADGFSKGIFMPCKLYREIILQSGRAQYITELSILALCTWGYFHFTNT